MDPPTKDGDGEGGGERFLERGYHTSSLLGGFGVVAAASLYGQYNDYVIRCLRRNPRLRGTVLAGGADRLRVRPGDKVPLDGVVIEGPELHLHARRVVIAAGAHSRANHGFANIGLGGTGWTATDRQSAPSSPAPARWTPGSFGRHGPGRCGRLCR